MDELPEGDDEPEVTWGPRLFYAAIVVSLVYFWWLLIYDHGVKPMHGG